MDKEKLIEDIIATLDNNVEKGTGHINISVDSEKENDTTEKVEETIGCTICAR